MKNLVKNTFRSFKNNKISLIGLVFLLFFGLGSFCILSNTTANIKNEYTSISTKGNLHDFTAAELYDVGSASYMPKVNAVSYDVDTLGSASGFKKISVEDFIKIENMSTNSLYNSAEMPTDSGTYYIPLPSSEIISDGGVSQNVTYVRKYNIYLDSKLSSGLYKQYATTKKDTRFTNFVFKVTNTYKKEQEDARVKSYHDLINDKTPTDHSEELARLNIFADDYQNFVSFIDKQTQTIFQSMTITDTPLSLYIQEKYANEIEMKFFKSLNVTATKDNVFYKIIDSNIEDTIDKIVLFKDKSGRAGNNLYSTNDWSPFNSAVAIYDKDGKQYEPGTEVGSLTIPSNFNDIVTTPLSSYEDMAAKSWSDEEKYVYSQIMQIRFKRMLAGDRTTADLDTPLQSLASIDSDVKTYNEQFFSSSAIHSAYSEYFSRWYTNYDESITISSNGNVVFQWTETLGTPQSCTLSNWTGRLSVVNPQYMNSNGKAVIDPSVLNNFLPFRTWYVHQFGSEPKGEIDINIAKQWFNTLTTKQFNYWIKPGDIASMTYDNIPGVTPIVIETGTAEGQWNGINEKYVATCGGYYQVIWGCGLTPDFMYPVVDISRPTPNVKTESLVYCNNAGYNSIKLAYVNSPVEEYLAGKFKPGVNSSKQKEIIDDINNWSKTNMIWPKDVNCAYFANDTANVLNSSGFRVAYIPNLVKVIDIVAIVLSIFVVVLSLIICFVIIKRYVERNRINIGIMRANGISKIKIALSLFPFALIPAIIGGVGAYVVGLLLQAPMLKLFGSYWTLPTPLIGFNWIPLVCCILIPFLIFGLICFSATMIVLRTKAVELMKSGSEFKTNGFSRVVKAPFKHFGIMTRFRVSLAFNSLNRLVMMAIMSCLTMSSLVFAFTTFDKLNLSKSINSSQFDYNFSLQLTTPTTSGSTYSAMNYDELGATDPTQYLYNINFDTASDDVATKPYYNPWSYPQLTRWYADGSNNPDVVGTNGNIMLPSAVDMTGQNTDLFYLSDKICSRLTLDYNMGVSFAASNPWEIALSLMPANSRNLAADSYIEVTQKIGQRVAIANAIFESVYPAEKPEDRTDETLANKAAVLAGDWCYLQKEGSLLSGYYYVNKLPEYFDVKYDEKTEEYTFTINKRSWMTGFSDAYIHMIRTAYKDEDIIKSEYPIQYRTIPINWDIQDSSVKKDELYTYVNGTFIGISTGAKFDKSKEIKIEGIKEDSKYIKLTDKNGKALNSRLFEAEKEQPEYEVVYPVVVNSYAAHKYKLTTGDMFTIQMTNTADRFERKIHPDQFAKGTDYATFKVVGISVGTNGEAYYTTQKAANKMLGLPDGESWNKTHRYMTWQEPYTLIPTELQLVDLACLDSKDQTKIARYTFSDQTKDITSPTIDTSVTRKNYWIPVGFNGIYTSNKSGKPLTNQMSLYSYTGMYPGASVYRTKGSVNKFKEILFNGVNLGIANKMTCIEDPEIYKACNQHIKGTLSDDEYNAIISKFIDKVADIYGDTTMVTAICGAMDVAASDLIYKNLLSTFNLAETSIMAIIIPITIIIVGIISNLIITDSKKMAAMLKALGYSDRKNIMSILAMFIPTIVLGLILSVPLSFGLTLGYQSIIFNGANILVDVTQKWWYYIGALAGIGIILMASYLVGYSSLKRDRLVDQIK